VEADYQGFVCLEAHKMPEGDPVAALAEQKQRFMDLVMKARASAG
jgi:hypothetical protein